MGILDMYDDLEDDEEEDEELKDLSLVIAELYSEIIDGDSEEIVKGSTVYEKEYEKILYNIRDYYNSDGLGFGLGCQVPVYLDELIRETRPTGMVIPTRHTVIKRVERGLKAISRKLNISLPEKKQKPLVENTNTPNIYNVVSQSQSVHNEVHISNEVRIEIDKAIKDIEEELNKPNPSYLRLKSLYVKVKSGVGYGAIKLSDVLMEKLLGLIFV